MTVVAYVCTSKKHCGKGKKIYKAEKLYFTFSIAFHHLPIAKQAFFFIRCSPCILVQWKFSTFRQYWLAGSYRFVCHFLYFCLQLLCAPTRWTSAHLQTSTYRLSLLNFIGRIRFASRSDMCACERQLRLFIDGVHCSSPIPSPKTKLFLSYVCVCACRPATKKNPIHFQSIRAVEFSG